MTGQACIQSQTGELVPIGIVDKGFSIGPVSVEDGKLLASNYEAGMTFETTEFNEKAVERLFKPYPLTPERVRVFLKDIGIEPTRWQSEVLGRWYEYTPRDELRDRLNDWIQGKPPAPAVNTKFWRGL